MSLPFVFWMIVERKVYQLEYGLNLGKVLQLSNF